MAGCLSVIVLCDIDLIFEISTPADYWLGLLGEKCWAKQVKTNLPPSLPHTSLVSPHNTFSTFQRDFQFHPDMCDVSLGEEMDIIDITGTCFSSPWEDCVFGINWCSSTHYNIPIPAGRELYIPITNNHNTGRDRNIYSLGL